MIPARKVRAETEKGAEMIGKNTHTKQFKNELKRSKNELKQAKKYGRVNLIST